ncbi:proline-, glutamic acid- and leucine-rich protein 1 isoform X2 [Aedes albopictus]|uniref:Secreted protein n=1 Tax=Aedes albopictus TaxID=7160 RepID=A0ABM1Y1Q4_AEDAL
MACCVPFTSCFAGWFTKSNQNVGRPQHAATFTAKLRARDGRECNCAQKRMNVTQPAAAAVPKPSQKGALRKILAGKRGERQEEVGPLPEPCTVAQLPPGVLKHWAPQSRCCEEVLEEIRLNSADGSEGQAAQESASAGGESGKRNLSTRFRRLFVKQKTPEQLEMEALRKERKEVIKYLKRVGLHNPRMSYDHMKKLKTVTEDALESERQKEEIELKELQRAKDPPQPESNPQPADQVQTPVAPSASQPNPEPNAPEVEPVALPLPEPVALPPPEPEQLQWPPPEGPMEATDGTVIHPGTGLPVSAAIDCPGDVPCIQCNAEVIVVQAEIHPEPRMDEEMESTNGDKPVEEPKAPEVNNGAVPPPLPAKSKPRIVGFMLKPGVTLEDLDAIEVDPNYDPEEEDRRNRMRARHAPFKDDFTPKPLQNLRWTFGGP